ncbi:hypothetical protein J4219_01560 [Candidatus Woesearchaeota archaeon]|nr:hypothetical protein [Candidatus Woesearchaeota archaeon]
MEYLVLKPGELRGFLQNSKKKLTFTWDEFARFLGVNRSMIFFYLQEKSKFPLSHYEFICKKLNVSPIKFNTVNITNKLKKVQFPEQSEQLAEFLGIMAGDGHLGRPAYEISIALDKNSDKDYVYHVSALLEDIFKTKPSIYHQNNITRVKIYSKELFNFLHLSLGMISGNKMNKLRIPSFILSNRLFLAAFLRGVFDTDGSFHRHRPTDAAAEITSADARFLQEVTAALLFLGIRATSSGRNVYIYSKEHIHRFFMKIRPSNPKHQAKYAYYCTHGKVPLKNAI